MEETKDGFPTFYAKDPQAWRDWLTQNHAVAKNVWLIIYKKDSGTPSVTYDQALDEALCFGWIDSKINKRDAWSFYQFFAKRNPKSNWSRVNKNKIETLIRDGRMQQAGFDMIEIAKQNGTWTALDAVEDLLVPADMQALLDANAAAKTHFDLFPRSVKRAILEWILNAKQPETRAKRIEETVALAEKNIRANQYRPK